MAKSKETLRRERNPLKKMVKALHDARQAQFSLSNELLEQRELFEKKHKKLIDSLHAADIAVGLNYETLARWMVDRHDSTNQTALGPGLDIRSRTEVIYEEEHVLHWVIDNAPFLLEVNIPRFKQLVRAFPEDIIYQGTAIAEVREVPTAYIAKDLARAVEALE